MRDREQLNIRIRAQDGRKELEATDLECPQHVLDESELPEGPVHFLAGMIDFRQLADVWEFGL